LYPNPADNIVNVVASQNATARLFDINGKQVITPSDLIAGKEIQINVQNLGKGIYTLKVYNNNSLKTEKVVIKK